MTSELAILDFIQEHLGCQFLDWLMPKLTLLGSGGSLWAVTAVILLLIPKTRRTGMIMVVSLVLDVLLCNIILKPLVARPRPFQVNTAVTLLVRAPGGYSFPSGHSAVAFAGTGALIFGKSRLWPPYLVAAVLVAFSRLYLYVHYPTDVLSGAALGLLCGFIASRLVALAEKQMARRKS